MLPEDPPLSRSPDLICLQQPSFLNQIESQVSGLLSPWAPAGQDVVCGTVLRSTCCLAPGPAAALSCSRHQGPRQAQGLTSRFWLAHEKCQHHGHRGSLGAPCLPSSHTCGSRLWLVPLVCTVTLFCPQGPCLIKCLPLQKNFPCPQGDVGSPVTPHQALRCPLAFPAARTRASCTCSSPPCCGGAGSDGAAPRSVHRAGRVGGQGRWRTEQGSSVKWFSSPKTTLCLF